MGSSNVCVGSTIFGARPPKVNCSHVMGEMLDVISVALQTTTIQVVDTLCFFLASGWLLGYC